MADAPKSFFLNSEIHQYLVTHAAPVDDVQRWLIDETNSRFSERSMMQISPEQGAVMTLITRLVGARHAVEVGTFTGYSALCIAYGLPADGHLLCCDVSEEWTDVAQEGWKRAGVAERVELRIAPAIETLRALPRDALLDLAFIDADKTGYLDYYEELLPRVRSNGVIMVDNTLWGGRIADSSMTDDDTLAIRAFNDHVAADDRVDSAILTLGDGVTIARKR
jgi:caffeoyl-CoA O-methyltransferase